MPPLHFLVLMLGEVFLAQALSNVHYFHSADGPVLNNSDAFDGYTFRAGAPGDQDECRELVYSESGVVVLSVTSDPVNSGIQPFIPANQGVIVDVISDQPNARARVVLCVTGGTDLPSSAAQTITVTLANAATYAATPSTAPTWRFTFSVVYTSYANTDLPVAFAFGDALLQPPVVYPGGAVVPPVTVSLITATGHTAILQSRAVVHVYAWPPAAGSLYAPVAPSPGAGPEPVPTPSSASPAASAELLAALDPIARIDIPTGVASAVLSRVVSSVRVPVGVGAHFVFVLASAALPPSPETAFDAAACPVGGHNRAFGVAHAALRVAVPPCGAGSWRPPGSSLVECVDCPPGAACDGTSTPACLPGFWRATSFVSTSPVPRGKFSSKVCVVGVGGVAPSLPSGGRARVGAGTADGDPAGGGGSTDTGAGVFDGIVGANLPLPTLPKVRHAAWTSARSQVALGAMLDRCARPPPRRAGCFIYTTDEDLMAAVVGEPAVAPMERPLSLPSWLGSGVVLPPIIADAARSAAYRAAYATTFVAREDLAAAIDAFAAAQRRGLTLTEAVVASVVVGDAILGLPSISPAELARLSGTRSTASLGDGSRRGEAGADRWDGDGGAVYDGGGGGPHSHLSGVGGADTWPAAAAAGGGAGAGAAVGSVALWDARRGPLRVGVSASRRRALRLMTVTSALPLSSTVDAVADAADLSYYLYERVSGSGGASSGGMLAQTYATLFGGTTRAADAGLHGGDERGVSGWNRTAVAAAANEDDEWYSGEGETTWHATRASSTGGATADGMTPAVATIGQWLATCTHCGDSADTYTTDPDPTCLGGQTARCTEGYTGYVCRTCVQGYGRDKDECQECPSEVRIGTAIVWTHAS